MCQERICHQFTPILFMHIDDKKPGQTWKDEDMER